MTKRDEQAREYAAEADGNTATTVQEVAAALRSIGLARHAALVTLWHFDMVRHREAALRLRNEMEKLLQRYYSVTQPERPYDAEGKPPAESSD